MGARIEIADVSGIVVGYEAAREPVDAARKDLTEEDVIRIATLARDASGQKTELAESPELTDTGASTGADRIWTVRWRRVCNGVPFIEDEAVVVISGATGKLRSLSVDFSARPPGEFEELTTAQEAVRVATTAVARAEPTRTLQALPPRKVVMIVDGPDAQSPKSSRVVWCCRFDTPSHQKYQAMVDVETGAVLSSGPATGDDL